MLTLFGRFLIRLVLQITDFQVFRLQAVHRRRPQSGRLSSADILRTRGEGSISDVNVCTFWCRKISDFSKLMACPHGQGGMSQRGHFSDKGEGK